MVCTHLILPMQPETRRLLKSMHCEVMQFVPDFVPDFVAMTKSLFAENQLRVSMKCWGLHNHRGPIRFSLQELFPVLKGARFNLDENSRLASDKALSESTDFKFTGTDDTGFATVVRFTTVRHGQVMFSFTGKSDQTGCTFQFVQRLVGDTAQHFLYINTPPTAKCVISPSLVWRSGIRCQACRMTLEDRAKHDSESTKGKKLLRCGRCWRTLCAPVWYCCAECQAADYPQHRQFCGKS